MANNYIIKHMEIGWREPEVLARTNNRYEAQRTINLYASDAYKRLNSHNEKLQIEYIKRGKNPTVIFVNGSMQKLWWFDIEENNARR